MQEWVQIVNQKRRQAQKPSSQSQTEAQMTRKSTQKYEVVHTTSGTVVLSGVSKTSANETRRLMKDKNLIVRPVRRAA